MPSQINSDVFVSGQLSAQSMTLPPNTVSDPGVAAGGPNLGIQASKLQHQYAPTFRQSSLVAAVTETQVVHLVHGVNGKLLAMKVGVVVAITGNDTVTVDLLKNGTTILTAVVTLDNTQAAYATPKQPAGYTSTTLLAGDVLEVKIVYTHGTGTAPKGVYAEVITTEDAA